MLLLISLEVRPRNYCCSHLSIRRRHEYVDFECSDETWQKHGFEVTNEADTMAKIAEIFKEELDGHPLLSNNRIGANFRMLRMKIGITTILFYLEMPKLQPTTLLVQELN